MKGGGHVPRDACGGGGNRGVRDAQRRLAAILRAARKLSVTSDDLVRLPAARRLTDAGGGGAATSPEEHHEGGAGGGGGGGGGRHVLLPLVASGVALLAALLLFLCAGDGPPLARLRNASDPVPATAAGLAKQRVLRAAAAAAAAAAEAAASSGPKPRVYDRRDPGGGYRSNAYGANAYSGGGGGERSHSGGGSVGPGNGRITTARSGGRSLAEREGTPDDGEESADSLFDAPIRLMRR